MVQRFPPLLGQLVHVVTGLLLHPVILQLYCNNVLCHVHCDTKGAYIWRVGPALGPGSSGDGGPTPPSHCIPQPAFLGMHSLSWDSGGGVCVPLTVTSSVHPSYQCMLVHVWFPSAPWTWTCPLFVCFMHYQDLGLPLIFLNWKCFFNWSHRGPTPVLWFEAILSGLWALWFTLTPIWMLKGLILICMPLKSKSFKIRDEPLPLQFHLRPVPVSLLMYSSFAFASFPDDFPAF